MAKSLQDQLLEAGAVKKDRATKLKKDKHKQGKQRLRGAAEPDQIKAQAQRAQAEKLERDRALSRQRQDEADQKAVLAQVRQLIETNGLDDGDAETPYNFTCEGVIRTILVTPALQSSLVNGHVAIVQLDESYVLVAAPVAEKIRERAPAAVALLNSSQATPVDADDPYADYKIPDDLTW